MGGSVTISAEERDLLYHRIMIHLAGIDRVWLAARHHDYAEADRLGRQICDELQIVLEDLGWGDTRGAEPVELRSPLDVVRRTVEFLREQASSDVADERKGPEALHLAEEENRQVRVVCHRLLEALDRTLARPEGSRDG